MFGSVIARVVATVALVGFFFWIPIPLFISSYYVSHTSSTDEYWQHAIITAAGIFTQNIFMVVLFSSPLLRLRLGMTLPKSGKNMVKAAAKNGIITSAAGIGSGIAFLLPALHKDKSALHSALSAAFFLDCKCSYLTPSAWWMMMMMMMMMMTMGNGSP